MKEEVKLMLDARTFLWEEELASSFSRQLRIQLAKEDFSDKAQRKTTSLEALVLSGSTCVHVLMDLIPVSNTFLPLWNHYP